MQLVIVLQLKKLTRLMQWNVRMKIIKVPNVPTLAALALKIRAFRRLNPS